MIDSALQHLTREIDLFLPARDPALVFRLAQDGKILHRDDGANIIRCRVLLTEEALQKWSAYLDS